MKDFTKDILVNNLYLLIKVKEKKIGEFEVEAGVSAGYLSRMSKDVNAKPGIDFIVKAADVLNISVDTLLSVDLSGLSSTEQYALNFLQKLKKDTDEEKIVWDKESAEELNNVATDDYGKPAHSLFSWGTRFQENASTGYKEQKNCIVFDSHSFGCYTKIHGDCYNMNLQKNTMLYLMDIEKNEPTVHDMDPYAKEIWLYNSRAGSQFLCSNKNPHFVKLVDFLFSAVAEYLKHPQLKSDFRDAIDAFMNDENTEDVVDFPDVPLNNVPFDEEVPF